MQQLNLDSSVDEFLIKCPAISDKLRLHKRNLMFFSLLIILLSFTDDLGLDNCAPFGIHINAGDASFYIKIFYFYILINWLIHAYEHFTYLNAAFKDYLRSRIYDSSEGKLNVLQWLSGSNKLNSVDPVMADDSSRHFSKENGNITPFVAKGITHRCKRQGPNKEIVYCKCLSAKSDRFPNSEKKCHQLIRDGEKSITEYRPDITLHQNGQTALTTYSISSVKKKLLVSTLFEKYALELGLPLIISSIALIAIVLDYLNYIK